MKKVDIDSNYIFVFLADRKKALLSMDKKVIEAYALKYDIPLPKDEKVFWIGIHKARTAEKQLSLEERNKSAFWLRERGYTTLDDGELNEEMK